MGNGRGIGKGGCIPRGGFRSGGMQSFFFYIIFVTAGRNQIRYDAVAGKMRGRNHSLNSTTNNKNNTHGDERRRKITRVKTKRNETNTNTNTNSDRDTEV